MVPTLQKPNTFLFVFLFMPFIKPVSMETIPIANALFLIWKFAALVYLLFALVPKCFGANLWKNRLSFFGLLVFWVIYIFNCILARTEVVTITTAAFACIFLLLLIAYELRCGNGVILLRSLAQIFTVCIFLHMASVFLSVAGVLTLGIGDSATYLFGMDNYSAFFLYPMLAVILFYCSLRYGKLTWRGWGLLFAVTFTFLITASITAAGAGLLLLGFCAVQPLYRKLPKVVGIRWIIPTAIVFLILICGFQVQNLLASLLDSMSKGVTLNSRTIIWDMVLDLFRLNPVFGHGSLTQQQIDNYVLYGTTHAHNFLLELLLRTGVVGTVSYLLFLCGFASFGRKRRNPAADQHRNILLISLVCQLVLSFMDFYPTITIFYVFLGVLYFSRAFVKAFHPQINSVTKEELQ